MFNTCGEYEYTGYSSYEFNVEGFSCDVTHGLDFSIIASLIKIWSKISICYFADYLLIGLTVNTFSAQQILLSFGGFYSVK